MNFDFIEFLNFNERPLRAKFNFMKAWNDLDAYKNDKEGLRNYLKKWRARVEFVEPIERNEVFVSGEFWQDEVSIVLRIHSTNFNKFRFSNIKWNRFKNTFISVLAHEMIHMMQAQRRYGLTGRVLKYTRTETEDVNEARAYLSESDEISAYAHDIVYNMRCDGVPMQETSTYDYYMKPFDHKFDDPAPRKMVKEVFRWLDRYDKL